MADDLSFLPENVRREIEQDEDAYIGDLETSLENHVLTLGAKVSDAAPFDPDKHPRAHKGQFGEKPGEEPPTGSLSGKPPGEKLIRARKLSEKAGTLENGRKAEPIEELPIANELATHTMEMKGAEALELPVGYMLPDGRVFGHPDAESHDQLAEMAGADMMATMREGSARYYTKLRQNEILEVGMQFEQPPTREQVRSIQALVKGGEVGVLGIEYKVGHGWPDSKSGFVNSLEEPITGRSVQKVLEKVFGG